MFEGPSGSRYWDKTKGTKGHRSFTRAWSVWRAHGHLHEKPSPAGPYVNLSVERWAYHPVSLEDAIAALPSREDTA